MSLKRRADFLTSSVFKITLVHSVALLFLALGLLLAYQLGYTSVTKSYLRSQIMTEIERLENISQSQDDITQRQVFKRNKALVWPPNLMFEILKEDQFVYRVENSTNKVIAGYPGLDPDTGWSVTTLDHENLRDYRLLAHRATYPRGYDVTIARFFPEEAQYIKEITGLLFWLFLLGGMPFSVLIGYFLSRSVYSRLRTIVDTSEAIAEGHLEQRVPLLNNDDEFDRLSQAVNHMLDRLVSANRQIRGVSVGIAHDLKTPVANIGGRLQLMQRDIHSPDQIWEHIQKAQDHIAILLRTLDALLRLGEIESGRRRTAFEHIDLSQLMRDLGESFIPVFEDNEKSLRIEIPDAVSLFADEALLVQMLTNLLENIIEHGRDGACGWLKLESEPDRLILTVGDDGPGISESNQEDIFSRFYRGDNSRNSSGNGLGLSLVKTIAELHGGSVRLKAISPGAEFEINLPQNAPS